MIKAVLFDLDGTLVNSLEDLATSCNYALQDFGYPVHETEKYKYFVGDGMPKLIERVLPEDSRDQETRNRVLECFMKHYSKHYADKTVVYNGIVELIDELITKNIKIAVVTNKVHNMAVTVTQKLFGDKITAIYGKQEGFPTKPDAALTVKVMNDLGITAKECVFVGDSGMDAAVAVNAGCIGIGVLWGFREAEELLSNGANYIVETPREIMDILKELN